MPEDLPMLMTNMSHFLSNVHFLRPEWFWALIPCTLLWFILRHQKARRGQWNQHIAPELLEHLIDGDIKGSNKTYIHWLAPVLLIVCVALAGPSWNKAPAQIHKSESALVVLLDLSPSMMAQDLKPSRLVRARFKLIDLLENRPEGLTALIAYAGEAHVITPLSDDQRTISALLPSLDPSIMPIKGSNTEMAVEKALQLFKDAGIPEGDILLVTDGVDDRATDTLYTLLKGTGFRLSILGAATTESAPIPQDKGGFIRDKSGAIVLATINERRLKELARNLDGRYQRLAIGQNDVDQLLNKINSETASESRSRAIEREFDQWLDRGYLLVWLLLPLAAFSFRRGLILSIILCSSVFVPHETSYAQETEIAPSEETHSSANFDWRNLFSRPDQRGQKAFDQSQFESAAQEFSNPDWQAASHYKQGNYEAAVEAYNQIEHRDASSYYNQGNALAKAGKLPEAIEAYTNALNIDPDYPDAADNKALVEELMKQQQQNQESQQNQDSDQQSDDESSENQQPSSEQQNNEGSDSEQQSDQSQSDDSQSNNSESKNSDAEQSESEDAESDSNSSSQDRESEPEQQQDTPDMRETGNEEKPDDTSDSEQSANAQKPEESEQSEEQNQSSGTDPADDQTQAQDQPQAMQPMEPSENGEAAQAIEQWLNEIPDDPTGLMRNKLEHQHKLRRQQYYQGDWEPPENGAMERY